MRYSSPLLICGVLLLAAACGEEPQGPDFELDSLDTCRPPGTRLASGESLPYRGAIVWVPGTDLVAYTSWSSTGGGCAIKTVDAVSGGTSVVDDDCSSPHGAIESYLRELVAAPDRSALYYTVGIRDGADVEWVLRAADPAGTDVVTLRSGVGSALALSPDGRRLAYRVPWDEDSSQSLFARDLSSGAETRHPNNVGDPIAFSPDGSELLYAVSDPVSLAISMHRWSLGSGADEEVPSPVQPRAVHWGASGIEVLAGAAYGPDRLPEYRVYNLTTGGSVQVGLIRRGEGVPYEMFERGYETWSPDGTLVAYWTARCLGWGGLFDCSEESHSVVVADARRGDRVRAACTAWQGGPIAFSPDGTRLVYHSSPSSGGSGNFYVVEVP